MTDKPLEEYRSVVTIPIQWGDQDAFGHVNNTVFLRWFESARIKYCGEIGVDDLFRSRRIGPILASITVDFRSQVNYPDTVRAGARVVRLGRTSIGMDHLAIVESSGAIAAEGKSTLVVFDYAAGKPTPIPEEIRREIERLEGRVFS